jgi:phosphate acetyltransferase
MDFMSDLIESIHNHKARANIVLPESEDPRILEAANSIIENRIADITFISSGGLRDCLKKGAHPYLKTAAVADMNDESLRSLFLDSLCEIRKHKNLTREAAGELLKNPLYFGNMLVRHGFADGMVAGACHSSGDTLSSAMQIIGRMDGCSKASAFFIMIVPDQQLGYQGCFILADCSLIQNPNAEELAEIAILASKSFRRFVKSSPKTAFLSYSTYGSARGECIDRIREAIHIARKKEPDLVFDGEFQMDAAVVPEVNKAKAPGSMIKGDANVLIFPDVNSGNLVYKTMQRFGNAKAYGAITQGLAKPVNDLSRGCSVQDIIGVVAITAAQVL